MSSIFRSRSLSMKSGLTTVERLNNVMCFERGRLKHWGVDDPSGFTSRLRIWEGLGGLGSNPRGFAKFLSEVFVQNK